MSLYGPYKASIEDGKKIISYLGNNIYPPILNVIQYASKDFSKRFLS